MGNATGGRQAQPTGLITRPAARDLSSYQYHAVGVNASGQLDYTDTSSASNMNALGAIQNAPAAAGLEAEMATEGTTLLFVDAASPAIAIGDKLGSNSNYHGVKVSADKARYFAVALEAATADGDLIEAKLVGPGTISA